MTDVDDQTTHFGFQDVRESDKAGLVHDVFSSVASRYDLMNDVMSMRVHRVWKDALIDWLSPRDDMHLLDVAGGTGDIAFRYLKRGGGRVSVCDLTEDMLLEGQRRAGDSYQGQMDWLCGDAMALPYASGTFDAYTIAFGIRNVTRIEDALAEAYRVLRPGGRFLCLEFSHMTNEMLQRLYDVYSFEVIPRMGQAVAGDKDSYQYLVESIRKFPDQDAFAEMIGAAGFSQVRVRNMSLGIAALHSGWKI